jgi:outer membrane murein-binding lipoprotein Lpp
MASPVVSSCKSDSSESGEIMAKSNIWAYGAAILGALVVNAGGAAAKQESMASSLRYLNQVSDVSCEDLDEAWQNEVCAGAEMRLRLCEKGLDAEPGLSPGVYQCFLRSQ